MPTLITLLTRLRNLYLEDPMKGILAQDQHLCSVAHKGVEVTKGDTEMELGRLRLFPSPD